MPIMTKDTNDIRKLHILENVVKRFISVTGQSISFIDLSGEWKSSLKLESFTGFCRRVISSDKGHYLCRECNNAFEKTKDGSVDISLCHMGVTIVSVPVKLKNNDLLLSYGQFLLEDTKDAFYSALFDNSKKLGIDYNELRNLSEELRVLNRAELDDRIELLKLFSNYVNVTESELQAREQYYRECQEKLEIENKLSYLELETMKTQINQTFITNILLGIIDVANKEHAEQTANLLYDLLYILHKNNELNNSKLNSKEVKEFAEEFKRLQITMSQLCNYSPTFEELNDIIEERCNKTILKAITIIKTRYVEDLSLESVAKEIYITPEYLSKMFKKEMGKGFKEYLIEVRMKEAQKLLKDNQLTVRDVASKVGYNDASYFSRAYKKQFGFTPRAKKS